MPTDRPPLSQAPDLIVAGDHVLTMDGARTILVDAAVLVAGGTILGVVDRAEAARRHPDVPTLGGPGAVVTPGFVNAHQHLTGDRLIRSSIPDDLPAGEAIFSWAVPVHAAHTADDDELSATLACVEAVSHGVTTTVEAGTVAHPARVAAGMAAVGMRGTVGTWGWDVEDGPYAAPAPEVLDRQAAVLDAFPPGGLVTGWVTLVGHDLMSDELLTGASALARARGTGLTFHLSPSVSDVDAYLARTGRRPLVHLDDLRRAGAARAGRPRRPPRRRRARRPAPDPRRRRRLPVGLPAAGAGGERRRAPRRAGAAGRPGGARVRQRERRRPGRPAAGRRAVRRPGQGHRASTRPGSAPTTPSSC